MLLLTSYERMRRYASGDWATALTDTIYLRRELEGFISSVSSSVERFLNRSLAITTYTEYFDSRYGQLEYYLRARPVTSITSVYEDSSGEWDGTGESEVTDVYIGEGSSSFVMPTSLGYIARRALRCIYVGGLAYHGTRNLLAISSVTGTFTVGNYVRGGTSLALGIVRASTATTLTLEVLSGIFEAEALTEYTNELCTAASGTTAICASVTRAALCESYPDITRAAEIQIEYLFKNKMHLGVESVTRDGNTQFRRAGYAPRSEFLPEARAMLVPYRVLSVTP